MTESPFKLRGAIEGFYGSFYTFPERKDLIRFLGRHGFNFYLYGPKNDRQHRSRWWDPYPPAVLESFRETISVAQTSGVTFCYAISFGVPLDYRSDHSFATVTDKFSEFYRRGCRAFAVLLDDITEELVHGPGRDRLHAIADSHARFCNRLFAWLQELAEPVSLAVCPSEYHGAVPFTDYLHDLGAKLDPTIDLFYSGPEVCAHEITVADAEGFATAAQRRPLLWDNYPVNDLTMKGEMHLGPLRGRDPLLHTVTKGYLSNLMVQPEASKIPLLTIADYLRNPERYRPDAAWKRAPARVAGAQSGQAVLYLAENSLHSCLQEEEAPRLDRLVRDAVAALRYGQAVAENGAVARLEVYFTTLDESCYELKNRMTNLRLRNDLLPWIEALEDRVWMARFALRVLRACETGGNVQAPLRNVEELLAQVQYSTKRIGGTAVIELAKYARDRGTAWNHERGALMPQHDHAV